LRDNSHVGGPVPKLLPDGTNAPWVWALSPIG
jgi:hypothetical protein